MNENSPQLSVALFSDAPADELEAGHRVLIDVPALALQLGVTPRFVRRLIAERRVPFLKIGKFIRFDPREIALWVESQRVQVG